MKEASATIEGEDLYDHSQAIPWLRRGFGDGDSVGAGGVVMSAVYAELLPAESDRRRDSGGLLINIDNGGTLTDFCVIYGGKVRRTKSVTTPYDPSKCFFDGFRKASRALCCGCC